MGDMLGHTEPKVWLVTGCSSGFGRLFIPAILARGDKVIATARNVTLLESFQRDKNVKIMQLDVSTQQEVLNQKVTEAIGLLGRIDVLVNNAGYVASGVWEEVSHEETLRQFMTNVFGALNLTRAVLPHMRTRKSGTIVFMSSISGWLGVGAGGPYSGSKFALEGSVECLHKETAHLGIETLLIVLGQFRTDILTAEKRKKTDSSAGISDYDQISEVMASRQQETDGKQPGDPELAVQRILDMVKRQGTMEGKTKLPLRMALGSDAVDVMRMKCTETLQILEEYERFSSSTDFPDNAEIPKYS